MAVLDFTAAQRLSLAVVLGILFVAVPDSGHAHSAVVIRTGFSSCGAWAKLLYAMWDLLGPGVEPTSPALAGVFLTIKP